MRSGNLVSKSLQQNPPVLTGAQEIDREFTILLKSNMNGFVDRELSRGLNRLAKRDGPPSNNMGGNLPIPPLFLPHCEKSVQKLAQKTKIDWLAFTSPADVPSLEEFLRMVWPSVLLSNNPKGKFGYPESKNIIVDSVQYGVIAYGASHGRNYVSLTGVACKTLDDEMVSIIYEALTMPDPGASDGSPGTYYDARLTRLDICLDFFRGERTWDHAHWSYEKGAFKATQGGRNPRKKVIDMSSDGQNLGRTLYIGVREGEKYGRIYEKGLEVFANLPEHLRLISHEREAAMGGEIPVADTWLRLEVEYKRVDKERPLPLEMMLERDKYFAGSYPYYADALEMSDGLRPRTLKTDIDVDLIKLMYNAKRSYGSLIHSLSELGFTPADVVEHLSSGRNNDKLVRSGLLSKIKEAVDLARAKDPDFDVPF